MKRVMAAPPTLASVIHVESGGRPFAVNVKKGPRVKPGSAQEAAQVARTGSRSYNVGLMQVSRTLSGRSPVRRD